MDRINSKILITKDECACSLLPVYGNNYYTCPNMQQLASKGTVFKRHYTAGPSTIMSYVAMFTGTFIHKVKVDSLINIKKKKYNGKTLFDKAMEKGYECHIIWDESWDTSFHMRDKFIKYDNVIFHTDNIKQAVGSHNIHQGFLKENKSETINAMKKIKKMISEVVQTTEKVFLWIHLPHVIAGHNSYGSDIKSFDEIIGIAREFFLDEGIYISADHGGMCGTKGKHGYGYDVYEPVIHIPLITPKIDNVSEIIYPTSNVDLYDIIFRSKINKRDYIYCDSQFCAQPVRKLAIVKGKYKYIYNKYTRKEELYDLEWDSREETNLISDMYYDRDRCTWSPLREIWFYPEWENIVKIRNKMRKEKNKIWRNGSYIERFLNYSQFCINRIGLKKWKRRIEKKPKVR